MATQMQTQVQIHQKTDIGTQNQAAVTLRGSAQIICEYLKFGVNTILFQRGIYPAESFKTQQQYGITLFMSEDPEIKNFLDTFLSQSEEWLMNKKVNQLSLIITNVQSKEVMECWDFKLEYEEGDAVLTAENKELTGKKELKKIQQEIREVMIQISATVSYLPLLDCRCSFDILVYVTNDCEAPEKWTEAAPVVIPNSQNVQLKSFTTSLHKMETVVKFKLCD